MEAGVGNNCVLVVCAILLLFTLIILTTWCVLLFICFFPRERVSHHSGIGLQRGLNRTKFMACGNPYSLQKCKSTNTNISVFFLIKQNHRGNLHLT